MLKQMLILHWYVFSRTRRNASSRRREAKNRSNKFFVNLHRVQQVYIVTINFKGLCLSHDMGPGKYVVAGMKGLVEQTRDGKIRYITKV